ncbi:MAG: biofilm regulation phosphoprotein SiaC [Pseudomonadota bacterium]
MTESPMQSPIERASTRSTPAVTADSERGMLAMQGDSYPENSYEFFGDIIRWVENYLQESTAPLRLDLRLAYLNTSSVRAMLDIFDLLEEAHNGGRDVAVEWLYDPRNERVAELAAEFKEDCTFPFVIQPSEPAE